MQRRLVGVQAVRLLAVLAQRLAVIAGDHDQRRRLGTGEKRRQQRRQVAVGRGHLAKVGVGGEARGIRLGRLVGGVRIEQVDPHEAAPAALPLPPGERRGHHLVALALGEQELVGAAPLGVVIVVDVEAAVESEPGIERVGADESAGGIAGGMQHGRQRRHAGGHAKALVVAHPVLEGVEAGQDVGVRRQRHHVVGMRRGEHPAAGRQPVQQRRRRRPPPAEPGSVGAQRVDGDEQQVERGRRRR